MSDSLLRFYQPAELGADGYPFAWHKRSGVTPEGLRLPVNNLVVEELVEEEVAIKDLVREQANNRCLRCGHPYTQGEIEDGWSDCDHECRHFGGEQRAWNFEEHKWILGRNDQKSAGQLVLSGRRMQSRWRILTVHHLDEDKANCCWWNLAALCQRCHLRMQRRVVMNRPWFYEHTDWFKPYAAGFYAFKYEQMLLSRAETEARLEELLAHEHRYEREAMILDGI